MARVRLLDDALANQIAAGEVVERPASAAKELLENAVDAGATAITVEIVDGGVTRLSVTDNGHGMSPEDAKMALRRHATSKLTSAAQLSDLHTLGFRGEALPSIASVSRFSMRTREPEAVGAVLLRVEGGSPPVIKAAGGPAGTEIVIEDLFFNMPARLKFLKKEATEAAHVLEAVQHLALCSPHVAFRLVRDGRKVLDVPQHERLRDRAVALFGPRATKGLVAVKQSGAWAIEGLVGPPAEARATTRHYHTFVNGRFVKDRVIMGAVQAAYRGRLERGRHPFCVLHLRIPPAAVDVNVHPAKTEVRFANSGEVHRLVLRSVESALREADWTEKVAATVVERTMTPPAGSSSGASSAGAPAAGLDAHRRRIFDVMERVAARRGGGARVPRPAHLRDAPQDPAPRPLGVPRDEDPVEHSVAVPDLAVLGPALDGPMPLSQLAPLGAIGRLLLCAAADAVVVIDLDCAERRIAFHRLHNSPETFDLTPPRSVPLDPHQLKALSARRESLADLGFSIEPFGTGTVVVERAPRGLANVPASLVRLLAVELAGDPSLRWQCATIIAEEVSPRPHRALLTDLAVASTRPPVAAPVLVPIGVSELVRRLGALPTE